MKKSRFWSVVRTILIYSLTYSTLGAPLFSQLSALPGGRQLSLAQAEELLLQRNQVIAASRYQLEVSEALRRIAGFKPNPVMHIGAEQIPFRSPASGGVPRFFSTNVDAAAAPTYTAQVIKIFERGGKRELRIRQADATIEANRAQILDAFRIQLFQLRQAFAAAILARENLLLAESIDAQYGETERLTNIRVSSGDLAGVESARVRAGRLIYRQAKLDAQTVYQQAARDILNLLNLRPEPSASSSATVVPAAALPSAQGAGLPAGLRNAVLDVIGDFSETPVLESLEQLRERALRDRSDAAAARSALKAAQSALELARAQRKRDIALGVEYQRVGEDHSLGMTADIPLFVYNNQQAGIAQAIAQQKVAEAQLRQVETQVVTDVDKAYQAYLAARQSLDIYNRDGLQDARRVRQIVNISFQRGEASLFELLDTQRTLSQAAIAANQARSSYQLALWQLEQATGGPLQ